MISYYARSRYEPNDSFKVYVINPHKLDIPRCVFYGWNQSWVDSVTLEMEFYDSSGLRQWRGYLDGRRPHPFSNDSIYGRTICNGQYVRCFDLHKGAAKAVVWRNQSEIRYGIPESFDSVKVCRYEEWDGSGLKYSYKLPTFVVANYDALYGRVKFDIYRVSFHTWKMEKMNVNVQGIDTLSFHIRTTADGKEMVYKTSEQINKLGIIENLFNK